MNILFNFKSNVESHSNVKRNSKKLLMESSEK